MLLAVETLEHLPLVTDRLWGDYVVRRAAEELPLQLNGQSHSAIGALYGHT